MAAARWRTGAIVRELMRVAEERFDVAVVGAGPVGLAATLSLAQAGLRTALVGPAAARPDGRSAALLRGSVDLLAGLGVWERLAAGAGALRAIRIVDRTHSLLRPPPVTFRAEEIGLDAFGWNVENARLAACLEEAVAGEAGAVRMPALVEGYEVAADEARLTLAGGRTVSAALVVAADGRSSRLRQAAGIGARERRYPQTAVTTVLAHARDHDGVSTEFHTDHGPVTLVPMPGRRSSLVWVTFPRHAARLVALDDPALARAAEAAVQSVLGAMTLDGPRGAVPLASVVAERLTAPRLVLAGEAAHALPPIGAQGLNLGFADVAALRAALRRKAGTAAFDPGASAILSRYARARDLDTRLRALAVDGLNRSLLSPFAPVQALRGLGLGLLGEVGPLRRLAMRAGFPGGSGRRPDSAAPASGVHRRAL